jgi:hypothetical protein
VTGLFRQSEEIFFGGEDARDIHHACQTTYLAKERKVNKKSLIFFFFVGQGKTKNTRNAVCVFEI